MIDEIKNARKIEPKDFEKDTPYFEGCMPVEAIVNAVRNSALRPDVAKRFEPSVDGQPRAYAVVQLRQDNREDTAYNMVGFQTKMAYGEQLRVFRMIPGLENAEFLKLGRSIAICTFKRRKN